MSKAQIVFGYIQAVLFLGAVALIAGGISTHNAALSFAGTAMALTARVLSFYCDKLSNDPDSPGDDRQGG